MTKVEEAAGPNVLVVDDDRDMLGLLTVWLQKAGFSVNTAASGCEALAQISVVRPRLVITDLVMEGMDGMALLTQIHRDNPLMPVIMLSGQAKIPDAVQATHLGSAAFLTKPVDQDELVAQVKSTLRLPGAQGNFDPPAFGRNVVYRSGAIAELMEQAELVADSDITVFINGDTGTGKEALAKAIHEASARRERAFIGVNCGAIPEQLLESELFGHEKGAFTGANTRHEGLFQAANDGTLFLDEIGDMPLGLQVKLLRVLQDFEVRPVGSTRTIAVNVRVISATHSNVEQAVSDGEFRQDLYYRLNVVPLYLPSLAERREDIPVLIQHFLKLRAQNQSSGNKHFAPDALQYLVAASWPGNVRQLINVIELCVTLSKTDTIPLSMAKRALRDEAGHIQTLKEARQMLELNYLVGVLKITNGHVANAAKIAGRNRTEFYKLLNEHHLDPAEFRPAKNASAD